MKKFILLTAFINLIFLNACSSETGTSPQNTANVNSANANVANILAGNINEMPASDNPANLNVNAVANRRITDAPANAPQTVGTVTGVPAPFNSTIKSTMNKQGKFLEIREFKDDAILLKVERLQESKKINVFLKNGKVLDLPYDKTAMFLTASPQDILIAVGVKPSATPVNPAKVEQKNDTVKKTP